MVKTVKVYEVTSSVTAKIYVLVLKFMRISLNEDMFCVATLRQMKAS